MLENLVEQLGSDLNMKEDISLLGPQQYSLFFGDHTVEIHQLEHAILLKGNIGSCPTNSREQFLMLVMEANLFGKGTRGAAIGLNEEGKGLTLSVELNSHISYKNFKEKLEDFISVMDFWQKEALKHQEKFGMV
jgi:hypothetical protein